jgi:hypothetical protein
MARRSAFAQALQAVGLTDLPASLATPLWGIAHVSAGREFYQPEEEGELAVIVPAFEGPLLVDLVACSLATRAMRSRFGIASVLGHDWIADAFLGTPLSVFDDALTWLGGGCRGVVILDWQDAPLLLREVSALHCESERTAGRLTEAFERPRPYPPILVRNGEQR